MVKVSLAAYVFFIVGYSLGLFVVPVPYLRYLSLGGYDDLNEFHFSLVGFAKGIWGIIQHGSAWGRMGVLWLSLDYLSKANDMCIVWRFPEWIDHSSS